MLSNFVRSTHPLIVQARLHYKQCYIAHRQQATPATLTMYLDAHNGYVQQLHACNGMAETYHMETLPQWTQELEEIYSDVCTIVADGVLHGADAIANKVHIYVFILYWKEAESRK